MLMIDPRRIMRLRKMEYIDNPMYERYYHDHHSPVQLFELINSIPGLKVIDYQDNERNNVLIFVKFDNKNTGTLNILSRTFDKNYGNDRELWQCIFDKDPRSNGFCFKFETYTRGDPDRKMLALGKLYNNLSYWKNAYDYRRNVFNYMTNGCPIIEAVVPPAKCLECEHYKRGVDGL